MLIIKGAGEILSVVAFKTRAVAVIAKFVMRVVGDNLIDEQHPERSSVYWNSEARGNVGIWSAHNVQLHKENSCRRWIELSS
jgi:hypothetical protein